MDLIGSTGSLEGLSDRDFNGLAVGRTTGLEFQVGQVQS